MPEATLNFPVTTVSENETESTFLGTISVENSENDPVSFSIKEIRYFIDDSSSHASIDEEEVDSKHFSVVGSAIYSNAPFDFELMPRNPYGPDSTVSLVVYATDSTGKTTSFFTDVSVTDVDETVKGGPGNDRLIGKIGVNQYEGGAGDDIVTGEKYGDTLKGDSGNDTLIGNGGDDVLDGGTGNDRIFGGNGSDTLTGGRGNDLLDGGAGSSYSTEIRDYYLPNRLTGGLGKDRLVDRGDDLFVYTAIAESTATASGRDTILDWTGKSQISLQAIDAMTTLTGNNVFRFIGTKDFTGKAGELRYDKAKSDTYIYADVNGDRKADFSIHLDERTTLDKYDFIL